MPRSSASHRHAGTDVGHAGRLDDDVERQRAELVDAAEGDAPPFSMARTAASVVVGVGGGDAGLGQRLLGPLALRRRGRRTA